MTPLLLLLRLNQRLIKIEAKEKKRVADAIVSATRFFLYGCYSCFNQRRNIRGVSSMMKNSRKS